MGRSCPPASNSQALPSELQAGGSSCPLYAIAGEIPRVASRQETPIRSLPLLGNSATVQRKRKTVGSLLQARRSQRWRGNPSRKLPPVYAITRKSGISHRWHKRRGFLPVSTARASPTMGGSFLPACNLDCFVSVFGQIPPKVDSPWGPVLHF